MNKRTFLRVAGTGLFLAVGVTTLAACQPPAPPPVPGQPLTWAQQHQLDLQEAQVMHDHSKQEKCRPGNNCPKF